MPVYRDTQVQRIVNQKKSQHWLPALASLSLTELRPSSRPRGSSVKIRDLTFRKTVYGTNTQALVPVAFITPLYVM